MTDPQTIPEFNLFGETSAFPDVIHCERIRDRALRHDWQISPHRHAEMVQIFYMERGTASIWTDGQRHRLKDANLLFMPVHVVHRLQFIQGAEGVVLSFPLPVVNGIPALGAEGAAALRHPILAPVDPGMAALILQLEEVFRQVGIYRASQLITLSQALLVSVAAKAAARDASEAPLIHRRMGEFDRLLRHNIMTGWGVGQFAQTMGITPGHLNRMCRAATAVSASRYIETAQMTEARRLLAFTQLGVAEIGYRLGFEDPPYFSRRFHQITGETPSAYRARFAT